MSETSKTMIGLAFLLANPILLAILLIGVAVFFIVGYLTLVLLGLVTAIIFAIVGVGIVWLLGMVNKDFLKNYPLVIMIIPVLFIFGYVADHMQSLGFSLIPAINNSIIIAQQDLFGSAQMAIYGPYLVAVIALIVAATSLVISWMVKSKYWVGRRKRH